MILRDLLGIYAVAFPIKAKSAWMGRKLLRSSSLEEFFDRLKEHKSDRFSFYEELASSKVRALAEILDYLNINPHGLAVLDIGPGYGEFLDKCNEMGAARLNFIELDPVFFAFNRLKGYSGESANHLFSMKRWPENMLDLIWVSGSINANILISSRIGRKILTQWLGFLDHALRPSGHVIIKPWFRCERGERCLADALDNSFTSIMFNFGYSVLPFFEGHNREPEYPVTFFKKLKY